MDKECQLREPVRSLCRLALAETQLQAGMVVAALDIGIGGEFLNKPHERGAIVEILHTLEVEHDGL